LNLQWTFIIARPGSSCSKGGERHPLNNPKGFGSLNFIHGPSFEQLGPGLQLDLQRQDNRLVEVQTKVRVVVDSKPDRTNAQGI